MPTGFLTVDDLVPRDFLKRPRSVVVESGNGMGKTHAASEYAVMLQKIGPLDRIYILEFSQRGIENACNKVVKHGGWCIRHLGFEKYCPFVQKYRFLMDRGIPLGYVCSLCPFFKGKSKLSYNVFINQLNNNNKTVVNPSIYSYGLQENSKVCTHPVLRSFVLDPTFEYRANLKLSETPIIATPAQIFLNHATIGTWKKYRNRQRKPRKVLLIIDEADALFYDGLKVEIKQLNFSQDDYNILSAFSTKTRDLTRLIDIYGGVLKLLREIDSNYNNVEKEHLDKLNRLLKQAEPLLRSFERKRRQIVEHVLQNNIKTNVFRLKLTLDELTHIENRKYALKTVEKQGDTYTLYDYDYAVRVLFDPEYPYRYFWKLVLSATFPTDRILESSFLSERAKDILYKVKKRTKTYENVYTYEVKIFDEDVGVLNRNRDIEYSIPNLLKGIKEVTDVYKQKFGFEPRGITVWVCNKTQLSILKKRFKEFKVSFKDHKRYIELKYKGIPVFISYLGSPISRGIDMDNYDVSIGLGPLLRPPRKIGLLDVVDYGKGVSELVQALMRVVRSPSPPRPKLIALESHMLSAFYSQFYPEWFKHLFKERFLLLSDIKGKSL